MIVNVGRIVEELEAEELLDQAAVGPGSVGIFASTRSHVESAL
jgi:hypothetical protein